MKTTYSLKTRLLSLFIAAQFMNVQIQAAYGTEAITQSNPEVQRLMQQVEEQITSKLEGKSDRQINRLAYKLYKLTVKARNKAVRNDAETMEMDSDDQEVANTFNNGAAQISPEELKQAQKQIKKEQAIEQADALLAALGSESQEDGSMTKVSFNEFKDHVSKLKANDLRAPASPGKIILKVIYCLLILLAGIALFYVLAMAIVLLAWIGSILWNVAAILILLFVVGCVIGVVFGIRAVVSASNDTNAKLQLSFSC